MKIFLKIFEDKTSTEPLKMEITGNWALETMISKLCEKYYGQKVKEKIEDILKE